MCILVLKPLCVCGCARPGAVDGVEGREPNDPKGRETEGSAATHSRTHTAHCSLCVRVCVCVCVCVLSVCVCVCVLPSPGAVGAAKTRVVTACRAAIKANNIRALFHIINQGRTPPGTA